MLLSLVIFYHKIIKKANSFCRNPIFDKHTCR